MRRGDLISVPISASAPLPPAAVGPSVTVWPETCQPAVLTATAVPQFDVAGMLKVLVCPFWLLRRLVQAALWPVMI
jgi:hypothetical protein